MARGHDPYDRTPQRDDPVAARHAADAQEEKRVVREGTKPREANVNRPTAEEAHARNWRAQWDHAMNGAPAPAPDGARAFLDAIAPADPVAHRKELARVRARDAAILAAAAAQAKEPTGA